MHCISVGVGAPAPMGEMMGVCNLGDSVVVAEFLIGPVRLGGSGVEKVLGGRFVLATVGGCGLGATGFVFNCLG